MKFIDTPTLRAAAEALVYESKLPTPEETCVAVGWAALWLAKELGCPPSDEFAPLLRRAALRHTQARAEGQTPAGRRHAREAHEALRELGEAIVRALDAAESSAA